MSVHQHIFWPKTITGRWKLAFIKLEALRHHDEYTVYISTTAVIC
jgi:hypothetical protein